MYVRYVDVIYILQMNMGYVSDAISGFYGYIYERSSLRRIFHVKTSAVLSVFYKAGESGYL